MAAPRFVVVMGVSGSGKSTVARALALGLGWEFLEGDDLHPPVNVAAMRAGTPLTDADRGPWLEAIGQWIDARASSGASGVLTCSALRRSYRDHLRAGRPTVTFCHLEADPAELARRTAHRAGHFMPGSLLPSQLATLEPLQPDEPGVTVSGEGTETEVLDRALHALGLTPPV